MSKEEREREREERVKFNQEIIAADLTNLGPSTSSGPSKKQRKSLKTPIEKVTSYKLIVEYSVFWASRQAYLELIQSFLSEKIDEETLTSKFFQLRMRDIWSIYKLCAIIEDRIQPIPDLYYTFKADDFSSAINDLFFVMEPDYNPDLDDDDLDTGNIVSRENKLRLLIQEKFVPRFQQSCDLNDSFFRPQVDLD